MKAKVKITITKEGHILISKTELPADIEFNNTFTPVKRQHQIKCLCQNLKTSEHKVEYDKKAKYNKEIELMKETKFNKYNEVHKVASLQILAFLIRITIKHCSLQYSLYWVALFY